MRNVDVKFVGRFAAVGLCAIALMRAQHAFLPLPARFPGAALILFGSFFALFAWTRPENPRAFATALFAAALAVVVPLGVLEHAFLFRDLGAPGVWLRIAYVCLLAGSFPWLALAAWGALSARGYRVRPVGVVRSSRLKPEDDLWDAETARVELDRRFPAEALDGIEGFSHVEVLYRFHKAKKEQTGACHPRENPAWPLVGIFAQRKKDRPNRIGATAARVVGREGRTLFLAGLDAIDGTPVLDIKPVFAEYLPRGEVAQPEWTRELMRDYW